MSTMVRIRDEDHEMVKEPACREDGDSISEVLSRAIEDYRQKLFLCGLAEDFAGLRVREAGWQGEIEERRSQDGALGDNIESE